MESERSRVPNTNTECSVVPFWWSSGRGARIYSDRKQSNGASVGDGCLERGTTELSGITETFLFLIPVLATQVRVSVYIFMVCTSVKCVRFTTGNYASIKKKKKRRRREKGRLFPLLPFLCVPISILQFQYMFSSNVKNMAYFWLLSLLFHFFFFNNLAKDFIVFF